MGDRDTALSLPTIPEVPLVEELEVSTGAGTVAQEAEFPVALAVTVPQASCSSASSPRSTGWQLPVGGQRPSSEELLLQVPSRLPVCTLGASCTFSMHEEGYTRGHFHCKHPDCMKYPAWAGDWIARARAHMATLHPEHLDPLPAQLIG